MNLIQYKDLRAINLDHVRSIRLFVGMQTGTPRGIRFEFSDGSEATWMLGDKAEAIEVYEKLQSKFFRHV